MYRNEKQSRQLNEQRQARLAEGAKEARVAAEMRELTLKDRKHRLRALLRTLTRRQA